MKPRQDHPSAWTLGWGALPALLAMTCVGLVPHTREHIPGQPWGGNLLKPKLHVRQLVCVSMSEEVGGKEPPQATIHSTLCAMACTANSPVLQKSLYPCPGAARCCRHTQGLFPCCKHAAGNTRLGPLHKTTLFSVPAPQQTPDPRHCCCC